MDESVASLPLQTNFALQRARLDSLQRTSESPSLGELSPEQKAGYAKAARGFESMFVHEMYKTMREAMLFKDDKEKEEEGEMSFGNETLEGFSDLQFADYVSQNGKGMGIAQMMYKHLTGDDQIPQTITQKAQNQPGLPQHHAVKENQRVQSEVLRVPSAEPAPFVERINDKLARFDSDIKDAAGDFNVPTSLIKAIITAESAANPNAVSPVGAKGLMQLMNGTAKDLDVSNPFDPSQNIRGGTEYIAKMLKQFGSLDHAVAAYNAGPGNVQKYKGIPPFSETQAYVRKVRRYMQQYQSIETQDTENT